MVPNAGLSTAVLFLQLKLALYIQTNASLTGRHETSSKAKKEHNNVLVVNIFVC